MHTHPTPTMPVVVYENAGAIQGGFTDSDKFMEGHNVMQVEDTVVEADIVGAEEPILRE
jgi:hypothetical protein